MGCEGRVLPTGYLCKNVPTRRGEIALTAEGLDKARRVDTSQWPFCEAIVTPQGGGCPRLGVLSHRWVWTSMPTGLEYQGAGHGIWLSLS